MISFTTFRRAGDQNGLAVTDPFRGAVLLRAQGALGSPGEPHIRLVPYEKIK